MGWGIIIFRLLLRFPFIACQTKGDGILAEKQGVAIENCHISKNKIRGHCGKPPSHVLPFLGNVTAPSSRLLGVQASKTLCMLGLFEAYVPPMCTYTVSTVDPCPVLNGDTPPKKVLPTSCQELMFVIGGPGEIQENILTPTRRDSTGLT